MQGGCSVDFVNDVRAAFKGHRSVMAQVPVGVSRVCLLVSVLRGLYASVVSHILVVVHRRELEDEVRESVAGCLDGSPLHGHVHVRSIQWLSRNISKLDFVPSLVVVDEAHRVIARNYGYLWLRWPGARFLGVTATPCRLNGSSFTDLFDVLLQYRGLPELIRDGVLSVFDYVSVRYGSSSCVLVSSLRKRGLGGDYLVKEMEDVLGGADFIEGLCRSYLEYGEGRRGIVHAVSMAHAQAIASCYTRHGVSAVAIGMETPAGDRARLIGEYRRGDVRVLVDFGLFSEGFDCPEVEVVQLARPTLSLARYLQMVGWALRPLDSGRCCVIIDKVGLYHMFGLPSQGWNWAAMFKGKLMGKQIRDDAERRIVGSVCSKAGIGKVFDDGADVGIVVGHELLERVFCRLREDDALVRKRHSLLCGNMGSTRFVGRQVVELRSPGLGIQYVDLVNMNLVVGDGDGAPSIVKVGGVEFMRHGGRLYSRTRKVLVLDYSPGMVSEEGYYSVCVVGSPNMDCLVFDGSGVGRGSRSVVFLGSEPTEYYWLCSRVSDGSLVVMGVDGGYYLVVEGQQKVYLGCSDSERCERRLVENVRRILEGERMDIG